MDYQLQTQLISLYGQLSGVAGPYDEEVHNMEIDGGVAGPGWDDASPYFTMVQLLHSMCHQWRTAGMHAGWRQS